MLENAIANANFPGYSVYDESGKVVYTSPAASRARANRIGTEKAGASIQGEAVATMEQMVSLCRCGEGAEAKLLPGRAGTTIS